MKTIYDSKFKEYAKVLDIDVTELRGALKNEKIQSNVANYIKSVEQLEKNECVKNIANLVYGKQDFIAGRCFGSSYDMLGLEYHNSSEVLIALTDFIYVVGHRWDMRGDYYDSKNLETFLIPEGTVIEAYATTLHYNLLNADENPYHAICMLPKGTGDTLENGRIGILKKQNKWFIAHATNTTKIEEGDFPGLIGEVYKIKRGGE